MFGVQVPEASSQYPNRAVPPRAPKTRRGQVRERPIANLPTQKSEREFARVARRPLSRDAALESFGDHLPRQIAADEYHAAVALLAVFPWPLVIAVEDHVHALEHEALIVILEGEDAFAAQNVRAFLLHQVLHPRKELVRIERLVALQRNRLHVLVVIVLEPAVRMRVFVVVIMIVAVIMIVMMVM